MEDVLARARERIEQAGSGQIEPAQLSAAFERARAQMQTLAQASAELEGSLPEQIEQAVREGLRAEALPVTRQLAELRGLTNQLIRRFEQLEQSFQSERFARIEDLSLLVDLIASGWQSVDERLATMQERMRTPEATVYRIERSSGA